MFSDSQNPLSRDPIQPTFASDSPSRNSGGTAHILPGERERAPFNVNEMMEILDGDQAGVARRRFIQNSTKGSDQFDKIHWDRKTKIRKSLQHFMDIHAPHLDSFVLKEGDMLSMMRASSHANMLHGSYGLFLPTVLSRGTPQQIKEFAVRAAKLTIIGSYCQTELGHGSNVRGLETIATYDRSAEEFILNMPTLTSMKWWPGMGKVATHAIIYAQLILGGKEYGIHEFIVQIRDENHTPMKGVEVGDIGPKIGEHTGDSGFLRLSDVRVARDRMLAKYQHVSRDGEYVKIERKRNPYTHYFTMVRTRKSLVRMAGYTLAKAVTIAIRYSAVRRQGFINATQGVSYASPEHSLLDYQVQQFRLFKQIAQTYAFIFGARWLSQRFKKLGDIASDVHTVKQVAATTAGLKAFVTVATADGLEDCRKCCGGNGYLLAGGIAQLFLDYVMYVSGEGDFVIMYLQTARFLVKTVQALKLSKDTSHDSSGTQQDLFSYLRPNATSTPPPVVTTVDQLTDPTTIKAIMHVRAREAVYAAVDAMDDDLANGINWSESMKRNAILLVNAAKEHVTYFLMEIFYDAIDNLEDSESKAVLWKLVSMFGLAQLLDLQSGRLLSLSISPSLAPRALVHLCTQLRPSAVTLVDAFDFTDASLSSALGRADGNVYEALFESAKKSELNQMKTFPGYEDIIRPRLDLDFLQKGNSPLGAGSKL
eukprot:516178_1